MRTDALQEAELFAFGSFETGKSAASYAFVPGGGQRPGGHSGGRCTLLRGERKNAARKAGEEAGTKLLLPMMLMMVVAMILVLLPAYINFGSI